MGDKLFRGLARCEFKGCIMALKGTGGNSDDRRQPLERRTASPMGRPRIRHLINRDNSTSFSENHSSPSSRQAITVYTPGSLSREPILALTIKRLGESIHRLATTWFVSRFG